MKRISIKISLLLALAFFQKMENLAAAPPNWTVNPAHFQFTMNLVGRLQTNGVLENSAQNLVGVFVGNELRGIASPIVLGGAAYFFTTIYSNLYAGETLNFRVYVSADDKIYASTDAQIFKHNGFEGKFDAPFLVKICRDFSTAHSTIHPTCFGNSNGTIFTSLAGVPGIAPFTFLWSNGKTTRDINLLAAGAYTLTVTDGGGCSATKTTVLTQPANISFAVNFTPSTPGYKANFTTSGGVPGYLFNRTGMAATDFRAANDPVFSGLPANTSFVFKVRDANGCQKSVIKKTPTAPLPAGGKGNPNSERDFQNLKNLPSDEPHSAMLIFPNPASDWLNVQFFFPENDDENSENFGNAQPPSSGTISLFDPLGRLAFSKFLGENFWIADENLIQIPLQNLIAGNYAVIFRDGLGNALAQRLWVER